MGTQNVVYTSNEIVFSLKKEEILTHAAKALTHLKDIMQSEIRGTKRTATV